MNEFESTKQQQDIKDYFISYSELRYRLATSTEYPCNSKPVTEGRTEHEIIQNQTLEAVIDAIGECEKYPAVGEKVVGVDAFIDSLKKFCDKYKMNYKKASIKFHSLEKLISSIGLDVLVVTKNKI